MTRPRGLASILALTAALGTAGCGAGGRDEQGRSLQIWVTHNDEERKVFDEICREFETWYHQTKGEPVRVRQYQVPFDGLLPKLRTVAASRRTPDICRVDVAHVVPMAYGQALVPLDTIEGFPFESLETVRTTFVPAAVDSCLFALPGQPKHLWGLPEQTNTVVLYYNRQHFRDAADRLRALGCDPGRAPRSWDEFLKYAEALTIPSQGRYGYAMELKLWWALPYLFTHGASLVREDEDARTVLALDRPEFIAAMEFMVNLYRGTITVDGVETHREAGAWQSGAVTKDQGFKNGAYSMILSGPWMLEIFRSAGIDFGVAPVPAGPAGTSSNVGGQDMVIFRTCRHPRLAMEFLLYLTSEDVQVRWSSRLGQIPVRPGAFGKVDLSGRPALAVFFEQMLRARARPPIPRYDRLEEIVNLEIEEALKGRKSVAEAMGEATRRVDREIFGHAR